MALSDPMPRTFLATLAALLALAAPASAAVEDDFTIRGAGFGHGVGMSQYGAMGYASHGWNAAQILGALLHRDHAGHDRPGGQGPHPADRGDLVGADLRRAPGGLAQARSGGDLHASSAAGSRRSTCPRSGRAAGDVHGAAAGGGAQRDHHARRQGRLPRRAGVQADGVQGPVGDQRRRARRLPAGRRPRRVARVVAGRGAARAGDRGAHLRDHDGQERRLRPLRGHALAGLRRRRGRAGVDQRGGGRHARAGRHLPGQAGRHVLLLDQRAARPSRSRTRRWGRSRGRGWCRSTTSSTRSRRGIAGRRS